MEIVLSVILIMVSARAQDRIWSLNTNIERLTEINLKRENGEVRPETGVLEVELELQPNEYFRRNEMEVRRLLKSLTTQEKSEWI